VTAAGLVCTSCGAEASRAGAKFCDACGSPLSARDSHAEFKQVTVLFADVVDSMHLAASLGAERLREIMTALVGRAAGVVQRYGGTVDKFTGDGIMAVFGAPIALEDHAIRACRAALDIQNKSEALAAELERSDGVTLKLRVGLNSGEVIVGEIGAGTLGYTAIGEQVGMAQRMESVAPPGGVMLSESTGRLVADAMELGESQVVHIKGSDEAVTAQQLFGIGSQLGLRSLSSLVGRRWEIAAIEAILDRSIEGHGSVISVVGPAGIGKSRIVAEATSLAAGRGVPVFSTYCESHASDVPFRAVSRLLRGAFGVDEHVDDQAARAHLRSRIVGAQPDDLLLLEDLLGIRDPAVSTPLIDPDARRRRLTALVNGVSLARSAPAVYVIEDAHWIDEVSESLVTEFLTVIPQTRSLVLLTYRPEYRGALARTLGAQMIALAPLNDSEATNLIAELLGPDPSVGGLTAQIADRAAGNPFFAQEIVRDLADRRVLRGERGAYRCSDPATVVSVPATLQAAIAARIDRLGEVAKRTLNAAAVIGMRFGPDLSAVLEGDTALPELVQAELIDQVRFTPSAEYAFHNPLIRTVAYESQLKADRAVLHRRLAEAIVQRDPSSADENAALIAEHLEAAGDLAAAYDWHMRAGTWLINRDLAAAHASWYRAQQVADQLPADHPGRMAMRIAPRTLLTGGGWRLRGSGAEVAFDELRELCEWADDKRSLAIGMTGLVMKHTLNSEYDKASDLASEQIGLLDSIDDPELTIGLSFAPIAAKYQAADGKEMLRLAQRVIELAAGDSTRGNLFFGSPLALAIMFRGAARSAFGIAGWKTDYRDAIAMARRADAVTLSVVVFYVYVVGIPYGVFRPDSAVLIDTKEALERAERSGDETALAVARSARGIVLAYRDAPECEEGVALLEQVRDAILRERFSHPMTPYINIELARASARTGNLDQAIELCRPYANSNQNEMSVFGLAVTVLVESLLRRGGDADDEEVENAIDDLAAYAATTRLVVYPLLVLRLRALIARARGDAAAYQDFVERYRAQSESFDFEGHIAMATAMQESAGHGL
jgi:adenylate cyclase